MSFASWKERKPIASALRAVYRAETAETGLAALDAFEAGHWGKRHPAIAQSWRRHWDQVIPFFTFPQGVRRIIYTTNAIESLNSSFRKISRRRNLFPTTDSLYKLFYLAIQNISKKWTLPIRDWTGALNRFTIEFGERMPNNNK